MACRGTGQHITAGARDAHCRNVLRTPLERWLANMFRISEPAAGKEAPAQRRYATHARRGSRAVQPY